MWGFSQGKDDFERQQKELLDKENIMKQSQNQLGQDQVSTGEDAALWFTIYSQRCLYIHAIPPGTHSSWPFGSQRCSSHVDPFSHLALETSSPSPVHSERCCHTSVYCWTEFCLGLMVDVTDKHFRLESEFSEASTSQVYNHIQNGRKAHHSLRQPEATTLNRFFVQPGVHTKRDK